ncbi:hypothetical protein PILCRDRAFT_813761 [Piloderma croceum F 1598]|uniref:Uncharacterized protein n=1 Tax=Piloderma croceum (strain F 1598) TaxID=765440 RepID=A0A0C3GAL3_PILCF|nr:hypothetical protein PILCRDRAFT_813761 [Piloderma croceum F 1598]
MFGRWIHVSLSYTILDMHFFPWHVLLARHLYTGIRYTALGGGHENTAYSHQVLVS